MSRLRAIPARCLHSRGEREAERSGAEREPLRRGGGASTPAPPPPARPEAAARWRRGAAGSGAGAARPLPAPAHGSAVRRAGPGRVGPRRTAAGPRQARRRQWRPPAGHAAKAPAAPDLYLPVAQVWALPLPRGPRPHDRLRPAVRGGQYGAAPVWRGCRLPLPSLGQPRPCRAVPAEGGTARGARVRLGSGLFCLSGAG